MTTYHGKIIAGNKKFGIVVSRFNKYITDRLLEGAVATLRKAGVPEKNIEVVWVSVVLWFCSW